MTEENKVITRREVQEILAEAGWRWQTRATPRTSLTMISLFRPESMKENVVMYRSAFPDLEVTLDEQVAEGDKVVTPLDGARYRRGGLPGLSPHR